MNMLVNGGATAFFLDVSPVPTTYMSTRVGLSVGTRVYCVGYAHRRAIVTKLTREYSMPKVAHLAPRAITYEEHGPYRPVEPRPSSGAQTT